jgi:hypothetical protein
MTIVQCVTRAGGVLLTAALLTACGESATSPLDRAGGGFAIVDVEDPTLEGQAVLCKETSPNGSTQSFTFNVSVNGTPLANPVVLTDGQCATLATSNNTILDGFDRIDITEVAPPAGWSVSDILIERFRNRTPPTTDAFDVAARTATVFIDVDLGRRVTYTNTFTAPTGNQGCTPGYWKQPHHLDSWGDYDPGDSFNAIFGIGTAWFPNSLTLLQALQLNGGAEKALARHAVAALLNADQGFYPQTEAQVIAAVQGVYPSGGIEALKNLFDRQNSAGCPLN